MNTGPDEHNLERSLNILAGAKRPIDEVRVTNGADQADNQDEDWAGRVEPVPGRMGMRTRVLAAGFIAVCAAFWIFAFSPFARDIFSAPDEIEDDSYAESIQTICGRSQSEIASLPLAQTEESLTSRAATITSATDELEGMVDNLRTLAGGNVEDRELVDRWLDDWDIYIQDRRTHVERLGDEGDVRFLNSEVNGIFISERMDGFARRNDLETCETPGDI